MKKILLSMCLCTLLFVSCKKDEFENLGQKEKVEKIDASLQLAPGETIETDQRIIDSLERCYKNPDSVMKANANLHKKEEEWWDFFNPKVWLESFFDVIEDLFTTKDPLSLFFKIAYASKKSFFVSTAIGVLNVVEGSSIKDSNVKKVLAPSYSGSVLKLLDIGYDVGGKILTGKSSDALYSLTRKAYHTASNKYDAFGFGNYPNVLTTFTSISFQKPKYKNSYDYTFYLESSNKKYSLYLKDYKILVMEKVIGANGLVAEVLVSQIFIGYPNEKICFTQYGMFLAYPYLYTREIWERRLKSKKLTLGGVKEYIYVKKIVSDMIEKGEYVIRTNEPAFLMLKDNGDLVYASQKTNTVYKTYPKGFCGEIDGKYTGKWDEEDLRVMFLPFSQVDFGWGSNGGSRPFSIGDIKS